MSRIITQERIEKLKEVYDYAKQFPDTKVKEIYVACGLRPHSDNVRFIIRGARRGKTFNESFNDYKAHIARPHIRNEKKDNVAGNCLEAFTDKQLKDELVRRGWTVTCKRTITEEL